MINLNLDPLVEAIQSARVAENTVKDFAGVLSNIDTSEILIGQLHNQHTDESLFRFREILKANELLPEKIQIVRWSPIKGLHPEDPLNERLRLHAAASHGAHVDIKVTTHFKDKESQLPLHQALLILNPYADRSKAGRLKQRILGKIKGTKANKYIAVHKIKDTGDNCIPANLNAQGCTISEFIRIIQEIKPEESAKQRKKLAWVSPLPPTKSGIATYSKTLIPEIKKHYELTVVAETPNQLDSEQKSIAWLLENGDQFDEICYHIGNSPFHQYIQDCALQWPGTIVLHDLYLGDLQYSYKNTKQSADKAENQQWLSTLYRCHGYHPIHQSSLEEGIPHAALRRYPVNRELINRSKRVIVHSRDAEQILEEMGFYGDILRVPMVCAPRQLPDRNKSRVKLRVEPNSILICSVGCVGAAKGSIEIVEAWSQLPNKIRSRCKLVFTGANDAGEYGQKLLKKISELDQSNQVEIKNWTSEDGYTDYLAACDFAIQLRTINRGETSAAATDLICAGIPLITNAKGSMRELTAVDASWMLPECFTTTELCNAMERMIGNSEKIRDSLRRDNHIFLKSHSPENVANQYKHALNKKAWHKEDFRQNALRDFAQRTKRNHRRDRRLVAAIEQSIAKPLQNKQKQILVDVTQIAKNDLKTGIQRVVRAIVLEWIRNISDDKLRVEPVYLCTDGGFWHYRYAREWTTKLIKHSGLNLKDQMIDTNAGDHLLLLDLNGGCLIEAEKSGLYKELRSNGVTITGVIYDILPILHPNFFPLGASDSHYIWLKTIASISQKLVCISKAVADETSEFLLNKQESTTVPQVSWFHLGADLAGSGASKGWHDGHETLENRLQETISFLMVGTLEPRKGHLQTVDAISQLLDEGEKVTLVIVGKQGWMVEKLIEKINSNPHLNIGIYWLSGISDEYLSHLYSTCDCLIASSEAEGFGLPLIEAAMQNMPLIARDIPVFREVAGDSAFYFPSKKSNELADSIKEWIIEFKTNSHPKPNELKWLSWKESSENLLKIITNAESK